MGLANGMRFALGLVPGAGHHRDRTPLAFEPVRSCRPAEPVDVLDVLEQLRGWLARDESLCECVVPLLAVVKHTLDKRPVCDDVTVQLVVVTQLKQSTKHLAIKVQLLVFWTDAF